MTIASKLMKVAPLAIAAAMMAAPAGAADLPTKAPKVVVVESPSMFDIAFGAVLQSDYNFRGISQSDRGPGGGMYFEPRYKFGNFEAYVGAGALSVKLPTSPTAEVDVYGGLRYTAGSVVFDVGYWYYYYPKELPGYNTDFGEIYGKVTWTANDWLTVGGYVYYADDWLKTKSSGTYAGGTAKITAPSSYFSNGWGAYVSGEVAHYWFGSGPNKAYLTDYTYWNAGFGLTYKAMTLDLRYHDTDLSRHECQGLTGDPSGNSKWCGQAFIAKLSFDTTLSAIK